jgi:hypothetical protein
MTVSMSHTKQSTIFTQGNFQARLYLPGAAHRGVKLGYIGDLAETSDTSRESSAAQKAEFVRGAKNRLFSMGASKIVGPIDGDTWHRYRLPLPGNQSRNFLEPDYPPFSAENFLNAGMEVIATYRTSAIEDLTLAMEKLSQPDTLDQKALKKNAINLRKLKLAEFDDEMKRLHSFSLEAFKGNFLYSPIGLDAFQKIYCPIEPLLQESLVLIAEAKDDYRTILAVVLALPDQTDKSTLIVKTLARHPQAPRGLGRYLFYEVLARAHQLGFSRAECALMKDDNFSAFLPEQLDGKVIRKFALFGSSQLNDDD